MQYIVCELLSPSSRQGLLHSVSEFRVADVPSLVLMVTALTLVKMGVKENKLPFR